MEVKVAFWNQEKVSLSLNRGDPTLEVTDTKIM